MMVHGFNNLKNFKCTDDPLLYRSNGSQEVEEREDLVNIISGSRKTVAVENFLLRLAGRRTWYITLNLSLGGSSMYIV